MLKEKEIKEKSKKLNLSEFKIRWGVLIFMIIIHIGAIFALFNFTLSGFIVFCVTQFFTGLGIAIGYHRLLSHKSFETYKIIKYFYTLLGVLTFQGGPIFWVRTHRSHHANSDTIQDPHYQGLGFFYGHMGWNFLSHKTYGRSKQLKQQPQDLTSDPVMVFFEKYYIPIYLLFAVILYLIGGLNFVLWGVFFRTVFNYHVTWAVNSVTHRLGKREFETPDKSTNHFLVALLTFGEGWHNNHHRFPNSARHGLKFYQLDISYYSIKLLKVLGLAWNVNKPSLENIKRFQKS